MPMDVFAHRSLKTRITLTTLVIFLLSIWSLAFYTIRTLRDDIQILLGNQQSSTVFLLANEVNHELKDLLSILEMTAGTITPTMMEHPSALQSILEQRSTALYLFNSAFTVFRLDGTAIADVPVSGGQIGFHYTDSDEVDDVLKGAKSKFGKPHFSKLKGNPEFGITVPIRNAQGNVIGALKGEIDLSKPSFLDRISAGSYGKSGGSLILDIRDGLILSATDKKRAMQPLPAPGINEMTDKRRQGFLDTAVSINSQGTEVLSSASRIPATEWMVVVALPTEEAFAPIHGIQQRMLLAAIILTLLAGGLIWWLLKRQLSPMLTTAATLASMSDTDKPLQPLPITRQDEIGTLVGGFNRLLDILVQREEALKKNKERFQLIMETIDEVFWMADVPIESMLYISPGYERVWGRTCHSLYEYPRSFIEAIHPEDRERVVSDLAVEGTGQSFHHEYRIIRPDGTIRWILDRGFPVLNQMGTVTQYVGVAQDITERKLAEAERNIASVAFESQDGMVIADADRVILRVNESFTAITGYSAEEAVGRKTNLLKSGRHDEEFYQSMWEKLNRAGYWGGEIWNRRKDGEVYPEWLTITSVKSNDGKVTNYVASMTDIAERKRTESELITLRTEMQQMIEWQVASQTVAALSHEVNQPLASIALLCEAASRMLATDDMAFASDANLPERLKQILKSLVAESERAGAKVRNLLESLHRPDAEREPIAISSLLRDAVRVSRTNGLTDYPVTIDCATDMTVLVNRLQMEKVLLNLIGNSVEAMRNADVPEGKIRIKVSMNGEGVGISVTIRDEGPGISREIGQQIFHPFFTTKPNGMGMGLAISRALIQAQGGKLWYEADEGPGAVFCFTLPFSR
ncbi:MAG: PAS domain S-box protein [Sterolibacterium sp.]|nr:PAS domain S-box protein [Sterolibacterium sp.]